MRVNGKKKTKDFIRKHADSKVWLEAWLAEIEDKDTRWQNPDDVKQRYPSASILDNNRVIFNVKGNAYRMLTAIAYKLGIIQVQKLGTHAEYDRWDL